MVNQLHNAKARVLKVLMWTGGSASFCIFFCISWSLSQASPNEPLQFSSNAHIINQQQALELTDEVEKSLIVEKTNGDCATVKMKHKILAPPHSTAETDRQKMATEKPNTAHTNQKSGQRVKHRVKSNQTSRRKMSGSLKKHHTSHSNACENNPDCDSSLHGIQEDLLNDASKLEELKPTKKQNSHGTTSGQRQKKQLQKRFGSEGRLHAKPRQFGKTNAGPGIQRSGGKGNIGGGKGSGPGSKNGQGTSGSMGGQGMRNMNLAPSTKQGGLMGGQGIGETGGLNKGAGSRRK